MCFMCVLIITSYGFSVNLSVNQSNTTVECLMCVCEYISGHQWASVGTSHRFKGQHHIKLSANPVTLSGTMCLCSIAAL